jgi:hypothetical protein
MITIEIGWKLFWAIIITGIFILSTSTNNKNK